MTRFRLLIVFVGVTAFVAGFSSDVWGLSAKQYGWTFAAAFLTAYVLAIRASRGHIIVLYLFYKDEHDAWDLGRLGNSVFAFSLMFALGLLVGPVLS